MSTCAAQEHLIVESYIQHTGIIDASSPSSINEKNSALNPFTVILWSNEPDQGNGYDDLSQTLCSSLLNSSQHLARPPPSCTEPYSTQGDYITWVTTTYTLANGAATTTQAEAIYNQIQTEGGRTITQQVAIFNHTMWMNGVGTVHVMTTTPISTCRVSGVQGWPKSYEGPLATGVSMSSGGGRDTSGTVGSGDVFSHPIESLPKVPSTASTPAIATLPILPMTGIYPTVATVASVPTMATPSTSPTASKCPVSSSLSVPVGHVTAISAAGIGVGSALAGALIPALAACLFRKRLSLRFKRKKRLGEMNDVRSTVVGKLAKEASRLAAVPL